jgi:FAD dependent oxidoreductase
MHVITEEDAMSGLTFDDAIAWRSGFPDMGGQKGGKYVKMQIHDVPYHAILPEKLDGLLTAGRCISSTHAGAVAGKSMGNCMATGHAAGVAAALSGAHTRLPRELKVAELQAALRSDGIELAAQDRRQTWLKSSNVAWHPLQKRSTRNLTRASDAVLSDVQVAASIVGPTCQDTEPSSAEATLKKPLRDPG